MISSRREGSNDLELRLLTLPLVHFFETSFGRIYDKHFIIVRVDGDGASGCGECVAEAGSVLQRARPTRRCGTSSRRSSRRACSASTFGHPREVFPALQGASAATTWRRPPSRWRRGICMRARSRAAPLSTRARRQRATASRRACRSAFRIRSTSWSKKVERELAAGYQRIKIKIKPGWDVDAVDDDARALRRRFR